MSTEGHRPEIEALLVEVQSRAYDATPVRQRGDVKKGCFDRVEHPSPRYSSIPRTWYASWAPRGSLSPRNRPSPRNHPYDSRKTTNWRIWARPVAVWGRGVSRWSCHRNRSASPCRSACRKCALCSPLLSETIQAIVNKRYPLLLIRFGFWGEVNTRNSRHEIWDWIPRNCARNTCRCCSNRSWERSTVKSALSLFHKGWKSIIRREKSISFYRRKFIISLTSLVSCLRVQLPLDKRCWLFHRAPPRENRLSLRRTIAAKFLPPGEKGKEEKKKKERNSFQS